MAHSISETGMHVPPGRISPKSALTAGFTLIEMSIVLVIIGLIVGGILVGQNLIQAATIRAQVTQIEKYQTAVETFRGKYGALPGDISATQVAQFGFTVWPVRPGTFGAGDGNGLIECAFWAPGIQDLEWAEAIWFWEDLSSNSGLIEGGFNNQTQWDEGTTTVSATELNQYFPQAKIGNGNYVFVFSLNGTNYFSIAALAGLDVASQIEITGYNFGLTPAQAYAIDSKIDDGLAQTGNVQAFTAQTGSNTNIATWGGHDHSPGIVGSGDCFFSDTNQYATLIEVAGATCPLSIRFQ